MEGVRPISAKCPYCGREIGLYSREGVALLMGHRAKATLAPGREKWCEGGGRSPS